MHIHICYNNRTIFYMKLYCNRWFHHMMVFSFISSDCESRIARAQHTCSNAIENTNVEYESLSSYTPLESIGTIYRNRTDLKKPIKVSRLAMRNIVFILIYHLQKEAISDSFTCRESSGIGLTTPLDVATPQVMK